MQSLVKPDIAHSVGDANIRNLAARAITCSDAEYYGSRAALSHDTSPSISGTF